MRITWTFNFGPKTAQHGPEMGQDGTKVGKVKGGAYLARGSWTHIVGPKAAQDRLKMAHTEIRLILIILLLLVLLPILRIFMSFWMVATTVLFSRELP
jgi:hypothetical protein